MNGKTRSLVIAALLLLVSGCTDEETNVLAPDDEETATLVATVSSYPDGAVVAGAMARVLGSDVSAVSDSGGALVLTGLNRGSYRLLVDCEGYLPVLVAVTLELGLKSDSFHFERQVHLPRRSRDLSLQFFDADTGDPLPGIQVALAGLVFQNANHSLWTGDGTITAETDTTGAATLPGMPEANLRISVAAIDVDGNGEDDYQARLADVDFQVGTPSSRIIGLTRTEQSPPNIVTTNMPDYYGGLLTQDALYFTFDQAMITDPGVTSFQLVSSDYPYVDVECSQFWTSDRYLEIRPNGPLLSSDMYWDIELVAYGVSGIGRRVTETFRWVTSGTGDNDCEATITDLVIAAVTGQPDFDTRDIVLSWSAVPGSGGYLIYARDDGDHTGWTEIETVNMDFDSGQLQETVTLPETFDRYTADDVIAPLAGRVVELCVVPQRAVDPEPSPPHGLASIRDLTPPGIDGLAESGLAHNDTDAPVTFDIKVEFSEYVAADSPLPTLQMEEAGGDPSFVLDPAAAVWEWTSGGLSGRYRFTLAPGQDATGDRMRVVSSGLTDLSDNVQPEELSTEWQVIWGVAFYDFESGPEDWTASGECWAWGTPTTGPNGAYSGNRCWATNLTGSYQNGWDGELTSPWIQISSLESVLSFYSWRELESCCDYCYVEIQSSGDWSPLDVLEYSDASWQQYTYDLGDYADQVVRVRFRFHSDGSVVYDGVFIDDVMIGRPH